LANEHERLAEWSRALCLTPGILATQEAEIRRISVQSQPREIVCSTRVERKRNDRMKRTAVCNPE
jgi:hypothetical protein